MVESWWLWRSGGLYTFNHANLTCRFKPTLDCLTFVPDGSTDSYPSTLERMINFTINLRSLIKTHDGLYRFPKLHKQRFVVEFVSRHLVSIQFNTKGQNLIELGPAAGFLDKYDNVHFVGIHLRSLLSIWSHIQPDPWMNEPRRLLGVLGLLDSTSWILALLSFSLMYCYLLVSRRYASRIDPV